MLTEALNREGIERIVAEHIARVLEEKKPRHVESPDAVAREHRLGPDLGLSSLDLAQLVVGLELELEVDPFQEQVAITSVRTVGDLCAAYEQVLGATPKPAVAHDPLLESKRRAEARRARAASD